jgi:SAM-dependent methyltransferase
MRHRQGAEIRSGSIGNDLRSDFMRRVALERSTPMTNAPTDESGMKHWGAAPGPTRVIKYFSLQASDYQTKSMRFPWAWARAWELNAVRGLLGDVAGSDVLELGAGAGFYTRDLIYRGARHVWAVDISGVMLVTLPSGPITPVLGDAETVQLDRRFPILISTGMLEFVRDPAAVLANAAHHATPGARFVLLVPRTIVLGYLYRWFHRTHGVAIHLFDRTWFETTAPRLGWHVCTIEPVWPFSFAVRLSRIQ